MGIAPVAVYSDADHAALHVLEAAEAYRLGPPPATESYLRGDLLLEIARRAGADAIHPGYGFLSENADFAEACEQAGIKFIGPTAAAMEMAFFSELCAACTSVTPFETPSKLCRAVEPGSLAGATGALVQMPKPTLAHEA